MATIKKKNIPHSPNGAGKPSDRVYSIIILVGAFLVYGNTIGNFYNLDDELVTKNHKLTSKGISAIPEIFTSSYYSDKHGYAYEYRPVVLTSFAIEHQFFGDNPHISHFFNVLLYALCCLLIFKTLSRLFSGYSMLLPLSATMLFVVHPLHTEVVASIKSRDEILSMLGGIASFYFMLRYSKEQKKSFFIFSIIAFLLGIMSKLSSIPMAVIIPVGLVMFAQIGFLPLSVWSVLAALMSVLMLPLRPDTKVGMFLLLALAPMIFYLVFKAKNNSVEEVKKWIQRWKPADEEREESIPQENPVLPKYEYYLQLFSIIFLSAVSFFSIYYFQTIPLIFSVSGLIYMLVFRGAAFRTFLIAAISAIVIYASWRLKLIFVNDVWLMVMFFAFGKGNKLVKTVSLVSMVLVLHFYNQLLDGVVFYYFVFSIFLFWKKLKRFQLAALSVMLIMQILIPIIVEKGMSYPLIISMSLMLLMILTFSIREAASRIVPVNSLLIIPVILFNSILGNTHWGKDLDSSALTWDKQMEIKTIESTPSLLPQTSRPLNMAEMPIKPDAPYNIKIGTSLFVLGKYLQLTLIPYPLGYYYGYKHIPLVGMGNLFSLMSLMLHVLLMLAAIYYFNKEPVISFSIWFYLISIAFFSNIVVPSPGLMADRFTFIASLGYCSLVGFLFMKLFKVEKETTIADLLKKPIISGAFVLVLMIYSGITIGRNSQWKDHLTLFQNDIGYLEQSAQAHNLLAINLVKYSFYEKNKMERNLMLEEAVFHYKKAIEIYPDFFNAWYDIGRVYTMIEKGDSAFYSFSNTVRIDSSFAQGWLNMAYILEDKKMTDKASYYYEKSVAANPQFLEAYINWSAMLFKNNEFQKIIYVNELANKNMPRAYEPLVNLGKTYYMMEKDDSALFWFEKAFATKQNDKELLKILGEIYTRRGDNEKSAYFYNLAGR